MPVLELRRLQVRFRTGERVVEAVRGIDLDIGEGETVALVGESGSGKSQTAMAVMGLLAPNGTAAGEARYRGADLLKLSERERNHIRGAKLTMIFQEPMTSLDPLYTVGRQLAEPLVYHGGLGWRAARARALELLDLVGIPRPALRMKSYPHELSGGQRQRVMIAMALANEPELLIADEPTTALDVTVQAQILALLRDLQRRLGMAILFITHDLGIVRGFAGRVAVMHRGEIVEQGPTAEVFSRPRSPYTRMLLAAEPAGRKAPVRPDARELLAAEDIRVRFALRRGSFRREALRAVDGVRLTVRAGETVGVVGESGSGKSTLGRALLRLVPAEGRIIFDGTRLDGKNEDALRPLRREMQVVFQDPFGSLSPRLSVGRIVAEGLLVHAPTLSAGEREERAAAALREVGLEPAMMRRYAHELSGGQRQRVAIARALILKPKLMLLDEPTSALDRSVQKQIVDLLRDIQAAHGLSYIFISHDLAVVRAVADTVLVMHQGRVIERGPVDRIFEAPESPYTRALIAAALEHRVVEPEMAAG